MPQFTSARSLVLALSFVLTACQGSRPSNLGSPTGSELLPCPDKPNCVVSSKGADADHRIDPLPLYGSPEQSIQTLAQLIKDEARTTIVTQKDNYLWVEFESRLLRFVDDVEFYVPSAGDSVQVRSASRLGHSDMGVNRKRIEDLRQKYLTRISAQP